MTVICFDEFFDEFDRVREYAHSLDYSGTKNPVDGVVYPDVNTDVPEWLLDQVRSHWDGGMVVKAAFFRMMNEKTDTPPHQAHTDSLMGQFTMLVYINPGDGGTSLVKHRETGLNRTPVDEAEYDVWLKDTNNYEAWDVTEGFDIEPNKAVIFPSRYMHRAEPVNGFGSDVGDSRLVLTVFFDAVYTRPIQECDFPEIIELGRLFWAQTEYAKHGHEYDVERCAWLLSTIHRCGVGVVALAGDKVVGVMLMVVSDSPFCSDVKIGGEVVFYVDPGYRKYRISQMLIDDAESVCRDMGVHATTMVCIESVTPSGAVALYKKNGYRQAERTFLKYL